MICIKFDQKNKKNLNFRLLRRFRFFKNLKTVFFEANFQPWSILHSYLLIWNADFLCNLMCKFLALKYTALQSVFPHCFARLLLVLCSAFMICHSLVMCFLFVCLLQRTNTIKNRPSYLHVSAVHHSRSCTASKWLNISYFSSQTHSQVK